jgi:6-phosphogluconolactonase
MVIPSSDRLVDIVVILVDNAAVDKAIGGYAMNIRVASSSVLGLCLGLTGVPAHGADGPAGELVYIGARGAGINMSAGAAEQASRASGLYAARLDPTTGHVTLLGHVLRLERAQWIISHNRLPVIYSVASPGGSSADSDVYSLRVDPMTGSVKILNKTDTGGHDATHLAIDAPSQTLFIANHGTGAGNTAAGSAATVFPGSLSAIPLQADGSLGAVISVQQESGSGPNPRRQGNAQTHCVVIDPTRHYVLTADLGADRIFIYAFDAHAHTVTPVGAEPLPPGSGPRHLVFHPNGKFLFLNTELSAELNVFTWDAGQRQLHHVQTLSGYPADYSGAQEKSSAELVLSHDGHFAYLSLRGDQNSIVAYSIDQRTGMLKEIQRLPAGGVYPASFTIDPSGRWLLVTNENSDSVTEIKRDPATGKLSPTAESLSVPEPSTVAFFTP